MATYQVRLQAYASMVVEADNEREAFIEAIDLAKSMPVWVHSVSACGASVVHPQSRSNYREVTDGKR